MSAFNPSFHESVEAGVADSELQHFGADLLHAIKQKYNVPSAKIKNLFIVFEFYL
jgi:hypothetical protein